MCCLDDRFLVQALSYSSTISFRDNHSCSCWCFCHEQKATKVNGTHFHDMAGTAECVFTAIAPGCGAGMTKREEERRTPLLQLPEKRHQAELICWMTPLPPPPHFTLTSRLSTPLPPRFTLALAQWQAPQLSSPIDRCWLQLLWII